MNDIALRDVITPMIIAKMVLTGIIGKYLKPKIDKKAFENFKNMEDYEFEKRHKEESYKLRRSIEYGLCIGGCLVVFLLLVASFSAVMGWIENLLLEQLFITIMGCFISVIAGLALGIFYQKSKFQSTFLHHPLKTTDYAPLPENGKN